MTVPPQPVPAQPVPPQLVPPEPVCDLDQVVTLITEAAGADTAAIEALEGSSLRCAVPGQFVPSSPPRCPPRSCGRPCSGKAG